MSLQVHAPEAGPLDQLAYARAILRGEAAALELVAQRLDDSFLKAIELLQSCPGRICITGTCVIGSCDPTIEAACDKHLRAVIEALDPDVLVGVGAFAQKRFQSVAPTRSVGTVLHPSPASPAANRGWAEAARKSLTALGIRDIL